MSNEENIQYLRAMQADKDFTLSTDSVHNGIRFTLKDSTHQSDLKMRLKELGFANVVTGSNKDHLTYVTIADATAGDVKQLQAMGLLNEKSAQLFTGWMQQRQRQ